MTSPQPALEPRPTPPTAEELKRRANVWGWVFLAAVVGIVVGNVLANAGTTRTWFCLGSFVECEAIQITPLGSFGIFLQWTTPIAAIIAAAFWWTARSVWKEEVSHEAAQAAKAAEAVTKD